MNKIDARIKLITVIIYVIAIFAVESLWGYAASVLFLAAEILLSGISPKYFLNSIRMIMPLLIFTAAINLFFTDGKEILRVGIIRITDGGIRITAETSLRLMLLIISSSIFTAVTSPIEITDSLESLLSPLKCLGVPVYDISLMMSIALRFIPTLSEEMQKIKKAQMSRGIDFEKGNIIQRMKAVIPIIVPLFVISFRHADNLAAAMEARCYRGGEGRVRMKELKLRKGDYLAAIISLSFVMLMIIL